jgi:hypothetical protein
MKISIDKMPVKEVHLELVKNTLNTLIGDMEEKNIMDDNDLKKKYNKKLNSKIKLRKVKIKEAEILLSKLDGMNNIKNYKELFYELNVLEKRFIENRTNFLSRIADKYLGKFFCMFKSKTTLKANKITKDIGQEVGIKKK